MIRLPNNRGVTTGDVMIALALATVILALVMPTLRARDFRATLDRAVEEVEAVRRAAESHYRSRAAWPPPAEAGVTPPELQRILDREDLVREAYTLQWTRWSVVDSVRTAAPPLETARGDAPPTEALFVMRPVIAWIGAIVVRSADDRLLGELLARYGRETSFVRDDTWTLVLPERARR